jgi:hypothetical protein
MSCCKASLHAIMHRFGFACSDNTARFGICRQLPDAAELAARISARLIGLLPVQPRRGFHVAIDTHWVAYYGDKATAGIVRGQLKASTRKFFVYATACVIERGRRYTLVVSTVESNRPIAALLPLLQQIRRQGVRIRSLALDKAFFAADVFAQLQQRRIPYIVAVPHHRRALKRFWRGRRESVANYHLRSRAPQRIEVVIPLRRIRYRRDQRLRTEVYAVWRLNHSDNELRAAYRRRFAIESSYRQLHQAKAPTTSRHHAWRLLLIGLSLLF